MTNLLGEYPPKNLVKEQPSRTNIDGVKQFLLLIETVGSEEFSVLIMHPFRSHGARRNNLTIQLTIIHSNQSARWLPSDL